MSSTLTTNNFDFQPGYSETDPFCFARTHMRGASNFLFTAVNNHPHKTYVAYADLDDIKNLTFTRTADTYDVLPPGYGQVILCLISVILCYTWLHIAV